MNSPEGGELSGVKQGDQIGKANVNLGRMNTFKLVAC